MKLVELTTTDFVETVASSVPAPGGGSVAAIIGSLSGALAEMVCALSDKDDSKPEIAALKAEAKELKERLLVMTDRDTEAFLKVSDAFSMPKSTDEEKAARSAAIQEGLGACMDSPRDVMRFSLDLIKVIEKISKDFNTNAASDLGVAALSAETAAKGAWLNVLINAGSLKDKERGAACQAECQEILCEVQGIASEVYTNIVKEIVGE